MRFKKGSKVEILCKKDMPLGAWRCAEIVSGNGHTYIVRYDPIPGMRDGKIVDKVPRTAIRPCPPPVGRAVNWASGDIVEVLHVGSWKAAIISKVLDGDSCLIRLLGSFTEFKIHRSKARPRRTWQDDKWVVFGKDCGSREAAKSNNLLNLNCSKAPQVHSRTRLPAGNDSLALQDNKFGQDSYIVSAKSLKRASPFCSSQVEAHPSKVRVIQKRPEHQPVISRSLSSLPKKGQSWRLACLASKGLKMMPGVCTLHLAQRMDNVCIPIATYLMIYSQQVISLFPEFNSVDHYWFAGTVDTSCAEAESGDNF